MRALSGFLAAERPEGPALAVAAQERFARESNRGSTQEIAAGARFYATILQQLA